MRTTSAKVAPVQLGRAFQRGSLLEGARSGSVLARVWLDSWFFAEYCSATCVTTGAGFELGEASSIGISRGTGEAVSVLS